MDSLSILQAISFGFCKDWEQELVRLEIIVYQLHRGFTIEHALSIWPPRLDLPPHLIGVKPATDPFASDPRNRPGARLLPRDTLDGLAGNRSAHGDPAADSPTDPLSRALDLRFPSNNWAVDGAWTGTGKSAFAVDPHMPSLPSAAALHHGRGGRSPRTEGSYRVMGASFPGMPALPFGTNGKVAWGPTSNWADVTDLFVEKTVPTGPAYYETEKGDMPFDFQDRGLSRPPWIPVHRGEAPHPQPRATASS